MNFVHAAVYAQRHDAVALYSLDGASLTYSDVDSASDRVARALAAMGVRAGDRVALCLETGTDLIVAVLGVMRLGAAWVPIDPEYPSERIAYVLEDSDAAVVVVHPSLADRLPASCARLTLPLGPFVAEASYAGPSHELDIACVIYTSGSTGRPKGVAITHLGLWNLAVAAADEFGLGPDDRFLQLAAVGFSAFLEEVFPILLRGGTLIPAGYRRAFPSVSGFVETLDKAEVTGVEVTTCYWHDLLDEIAEGCVALPETVRFMVMGGERARPGYVARIAGLGCRLVHVYGPTETTATATYYDCAALPAGADRLPIGDAIRGCVVRLLDSSLQPVPPGQPGEVYIGGLALARGYLNQPGLTAARFVPDPLGTRGERLYRTGDLATADADGNVFLGGRVDNQLKIRGQRFEPAEIERTLEAHPGVRQAIAVLRGDSLVAYVVGRVEPVSLRAFCTASLPPALVPSAFVGLDALPMSPHGKLDYSTLPAPAPAPVESYVEPVGPAQRWVADRWQELLGVERVGATDRFLDLGGNSLLAMRLIGRAQRDLGVTLRPAELMKAATVADVAALLPVQAAAPDSEVARYRRMRLLAGQALEKAGAPAGSSLLSVSQHGMWVIDQLAPGSLRYAIPLLWHLTGPVDVAALRSAVELVLARHALLRSRFTTVDGHAVFTPAAGLDVFAYTDLRGVPFEQRPAAADRAIREAAAAPFDLTTGPCARVTLVQSSDDEWDLLLSAHHIAFDGWSAEIVLRDLSAAYSALVEGRTPSLAPTEVDYADFAAWQRGRLRGERLDELVAYWRSALAGAADEPPIPLDHPRSAEGEPTAAAIRLGVPADLRTALESAARARQVTPFVLGLTAFYALLHHAGGGTDLSVGSPVANRTRTEFEDVVGLFTNTVVLRCTVADDPALPDLIDRVERLCLGAYEHQELPFDKLVEHLRPVRRRGVNPLFQVVFAMDDAPGLRQTLPGVTMAAGTELPAPTAKFDLTWIVQDHGDHLALHIDYDSALYDRAGLMALADRYFGILAAVAGGGVERLSQLDSATVDGSPEALLTRLWSEAFAGVPVGLDDDFFELGGYSMLASELCARVRDVYQVDLPLTAFFETPTIRELAAVIVALGAGGGQAYQPIQAADLGPSLAGLLDEIEQLSDDEAAAAAADIEQWGAHR